jgi:hypothetical protein
MGKELIFNPLCLQRNRERERERDCIVGILVNTLSRDTQQVILALPLLLQPLLVR